LQKKFEKKREKNSAKIKKPLRRKIPQRLIYAFTYLIAGLA